MKETKERFKCKRAFDGKALKCTFCKKKGHDRSFCPLAPTVPSQSLTQDYVTNLLTIPQVQWAQLAAFSTEPQSKLMALGKLFNRGNPWINSTKVSDALRAKLGYWKAIGANPSVLSWLAYGIPLRTKTEPQWLRFPNHPSYNEDLPFARKEFEEHLGDGRFMRVDVSFIKVCNPQMIIYNGSKPRRCDDLRYLNSLLADIKFKLEGLRTNIPDIVVQNDPMFTIDLKKAYYSLSMEEKAWPYTCFWDEVFGFMCAKSLVFGHAQAVMYCTKVCRPILTFFRSW